MQQRVFLSLPKFEMANSCVSSRPANQQTAPTDQAQDPSQGSLQRRKTKLAQLTGRKDSVQQLEPFLLPETPEEAAEFAKSIEQSDKMKKIFGERPESRAPKD
jgi:hypothetical protein